MNKVLPLLAWMATVVAVQALELTEDFNARPTRWQVHGENSLFAWETNEGQLRVTWDSRQPNSFYYWRLPTLLTKTDDFSFKVKLRLDSIAIGISTNHPFTFQLAFGLINLVQATNTNFFRGSGINPTYGPRNLVEFNYFPDSGFGATFAPTVVSSNNRIVFSDNHPLEWTIGSWFEITLDYRASNQVLRTSVLRNGQPFGMPPDQSIADLSLAGIGDFEVGCFSIHSYNEGRQPPAAGSILAHGVIDSVELRLPNPPVLNLTSFRGTKGNWQASFQSQTNWLYQWEASTNLYQWVPLGLVQSGTGGWLMAPTIGATADFQFFRVQSWRP